MVRALGYSIEPFDPRRPGRLCRGRELWIRGWEDPADPPPIRRLLVTGAVFSDDGARDALRGLTCAEVDAGRLLAALFPGRVLVAYREAGELAAVPAWAFPPGESDVHWNWRAGGRVRFPGRRWWGVPPDPSALGACIAADEIDAVAVLPEGAGIDDGLLDALYLLTGQGDDTRRPIRRFNPVAIPAVLEHVEALVAIHQDKHGPALGIYAPDPGPLVDAVEGFARQEGILAVPFAIPPMLARWDRALRDHRAAWDEEALGPYPVPRRAAARRPPRDEQPVPPPQDGAGADQVASRPVEAAAEE